MHRLLTPAFLLACATAPLAAQNFVTNGDFSGGLTGWTLNGYSVNPGIEIYDTTGLGLDPCFACSPGGQVTPAPYPPNTIEQSVVLPAVPIEFTADIAVSRVAAVNNADAGTFWVEVNGVEIARTALGSYTALTVQRARLAGRFIPNLAGTPLLKIYCARTFLANNDTPRVRIDNISLQIAPGPTFALRGNRQLGAATTLDLLGDPGTNLVFFLSAGRIPGVPVPGIGGLWTLDPTRLFVLASGVTDANGVLSFPVTLPNSASLLTAVLYTQGLQVNQALQINLGFDQFLTFVN